ncbi:thiosulfate-binding protein SoxY [Thiogranum longum]|uniref:Thiosulfate-binding protein SoxY n=2 Tax=Thiogranum longum TaxID=1537524 RepID=A0A4R1H847_9GAMM|nr:thiosulfate oxidation carrier protein SoxY [Thiogranum longum]TCK17398.1 thiosulfate-binding protein SoxY [Thiogranum longum]
MINMKRRTFLKGSVAAGAVSAAVGAGLLTPRAVLAAWPTNAFQATSVDAALDALAGSHAMQASDKVQIDAPDLGENSAVVPVKVTSQLADIESISIIVDKNASPLTASFILGPGVEGFVNTRIKMGKTSNVIAVVKAGGKLYSAQKEVKITIGGCGG